MHVIAALLSVGVKSVSFTFAVSIVAFFGCGRVLLPFLIAVSSPIEMQHCMVLL